MRRISVGLTLAILLVAPVSWAEPITLGPSDLALSGVPDNHIVIASQECVAGKLPIDVRNVGSETLRITSKSISPLRGKFLITESSVHGNYLTNNLIVGKTHRFTFQWEPSGPRAQTTATVIINYAFGPDALDKVRRQIDETSRAEVSKAAKRLEQTRILGPDTTSIDARIVSQKDDWQIKSREWDAKIAAARLGIAELKAGLFCDQCHNPKSVIEKNSRGETFEQHLGRVRGRPEPAPPEYIKKAEEALAALEAGKARALVAHYAALDRLREQQAKVIEEHKTLLDDLRDRIAQAERKLQADISRLNMLSSLQKDVAIELVATCDASPSP